METWGRRAPAAQVLTVGSVRLLGETVCGVAQRGGFLGLGAAVGCVRRGCRGWRRGGSAQAKGWPYNYALHPAAGRGALLLRARRCSAPAAGERARWAAVESEN